MRIWLRPDKLAKLGLTPADVITAIKEQNLQAPGRARRRRAVAERPGVHLHGQRPGPPRQRRRSSRTSSSGRARPARRSASRTSAAPSSARRTTTHSDGSNGKPAGAMAVYLLPGANQLKASEAIYETMARRRSCSRPTWTTRSSTTRRRRSRRRSRGSCIRSSRRSSWSRSSSSSSCRTSARRSSRCSRCPCR